MGAVLATFLFQHDLPLVGLAAGICALAAYAGISLLNHARASTGRPRIIWLIVAAIALGFGIWSTHFTAMLSYRTAIPLGYDVALTIASLLIAIVITGGGLWFSGLSTLRRDIALGGALAGLGIASMHYTGMAAVIVGGVVAWDFGLVAASALLGMAFGAASLGLGTVANTLVWRSAGAAALVLGIVAMHFTGMGAVSFAGCYAVVPDDDVTWRILFVGVAVSSFLILGLALGALYLEVRRRRARIEFDHMRSLADAAVEGLIICNGRTIATVNAGFLSLMGMPNEDLGGRDLTDFLTAEACDALFGRPNETSETELVTASGKRVPVEVILRPLDFGSAENHAVAIWDLTARKEAERHIRFLAHNDGLTGLPNRVSFNRQLQVEIESARRSGRGFAVFAIDLDRFKDINDLFGHSAGDAVLRRVASALREVVGEQHVAARLGGDEFAVIAPGINTRGDADAIAEAILERVRGEESDGGSLISASVGVALFPAHGDDAEQLTSNADTALYRSKLDGRGVYRFFEPEMEAEARDRRMLEQELRLAISRDELRLLYQPQVSIETGSVTGFEALLRWHHRSRGPISPSVFIPIAEQSSLILQIGAWALRAACAEASTWPNPLRIAVNLSAVQIHNPQLHGSIREILVQTGLSPHRLEMEVTESALVEDITRALTCLRQIKALGVRIAMDDFGTGYASLSNLRAFPFDRLKIDRSFIKSVDSNPQSAAIVRAVVGLGRGLGLSVIGEGVERLDELEFLKAEKCPEAQGYFFGRPQPIAAYRHLTHAHDDIVWDDSAEAAAALA